MPTRLQRGIAAAKAAAANAAASAAAPVAAVAAGVASGIAVHVGAGVGAAAAAAAVAGVAGAAAAAVASVAVAAARSARPPRDEAGLAKAKRAVRACRQMEKSESTLAPYRRSLAKFVIFMIINYCATINPAFFDIPLDDVTEADIERLLKDADYVETHPPPIFFDKLDPNGNDFLHFIMMQQKKPGKGGQPAGTNDDGQVNNNDNEDSNIAGSATAKGKRKRATSDDSDSDEDDDNDDNNNNSNNNNNNNNNPAAAAAAATTTTTKGKTPPPMLAEEILSLGISRYKLHRAAFGYLHQLYNQKMLSSIDAHITFIFKGVKRHIAQRQHNGFGKATVGKDPIDFPLYRWIAARMLREKGLSYVFAHAVFTVSWNLMCRVGNAVGICESHLEWKGDALGIYFCHMKNDQDGSRPRHPRHVFANPLMPEICPILALALYWLCTPQPSSKRLFNGDAQEDRYSKLLIALLSSPDCAEQLKSRGLVVGNLGCHSTRKGSTTYVCCGSTAAPNADAITLRAGWAMDAVRGLYIKVSDAGDQHVGRVVCGLPVDDAEFALLPPHFARTDGELPALVSKVIKDTFPGHADNMQRVLEFALASLVFHVEFLEKLPAHHPFFDTSLYTSGVLHQLQQHVRCGFSTPNSEIQATGVPQFVKQQMKLDQMTDEHKQNQKLLHDLMDRVNNLEDNLDNRIEGLKEHMDGVEARVVDGVAQVIEEKGLQANVVTHSGMQQQMKELCEFIRTELAGRQEAGAATGPSAPASAASSATTPTVPAGPSVFYFNGRDHRLPENFKLPAGNAMVAWQHYCCPNVVERYPALREVTAADVEGADTKKRLRELRRFCGYIEAEVRRLGAWVDQPSPSDAHDMFYAGCSVIVVPGSSPRYNDFCWRTRLKNRDKYVRDHPVADGAAEMEAD